MRKFLNAEALWLWFLSSRKWRQENCKNGSGSSRCCELLDVELFITKLYLGGKLTDAQLSTMKEFGERRRAPHKHIWAEARKWELWNSAMLTIDAEMHKKGWIE